MSCYYVELYEGLTDEVNLPGALQMMMELDTSFLVLVDNRNR